MGKNRAEEQSRATIATRSTQRAGCGADGSDGERRPSQQVGTGPRRRRGLALIRQSNFHIDYVLYAHCIRPLAVEMGLSPQLPRILARQQLTQ